MNGLCYYPTCGKEIPLAVGETLTLCEYCGHTSDNSMARERMHRLINDQSAPTHDPIMSAVDVKAAFDASVTGRKIGKVRMDLVMQDMPRAIEALARVMTWALEEKGYKESDWLNVPNGEQVYSGGLHRHDNKEKRGQEFDDESGLEHAIHTAWNAMARVELILRRKEKEA